MTRLIRIATLILLCARASALPATDAETVRHATDMERSPAAASGTPTKLTDRGCDMYPDWK